MKRGQNRFVQDRAGYLTRKTHNHDTGVASYGIPQEVSETEISCDQDEGMRPGVLENNVV